MAECLFVGSSWLPADSDTRKTASNAVSLRFNMSCRQAPDLILDFSLDVSTCHRRALVTKAGN